MPRSFDEQIEKLKSCIPYKASCKENKIFFIPGIDEPLNLEKDFYFYTNTWLGDVLPLKPSSGYNCADYYDFQKKIKKKYKLNLFVATFITKNNVYNGNIGAQLSQNYLCIYNIKTNYTQIVPFTRAQCLFFDYKIINAYFDNIAPKSEVIKPLMLENNTVNSLHPNNTLIYRKLNDTLCLSYGLKPKQKTIFYITANESRCHNEFYLRFNDDIENYVPYSIQFFIKDLNNHLLQCQMKYICQLLDAAKLKI